jgi:hypothetical protein
MAASISNLIKCVKVTVLHHAKVIEILRFVYVLDWCWVHNSLEVKYSYINVFIPPYMTLDNDKGNSNTKQ